ncbi:hypothetical protein BaRGS_00000718 [Batillaria attramentaria]|uniref:SAP domain-containing protein n=1 Tax=Batillaria attramentaria TaxID=370345 RepID=A0ABD0M930_9CAEN
MADPCVFESMKVQELKQYLKANSQCTSGKKSELIRRAKGTFSLLLMKAVGDSERPGSNIDTALSENKDGEFHHVANLNGWVDVEAVAMSQWPEVTDKELYHHIDDNSEECYIRGLVIPSAASSDTKKYPDRRVWIRASKVTGNVNAGYCTCTAGLEGSCNHVAALLYALVDVTDTKIRGMDASTSKTCKWKQPRQRRLSPKKACEMPSAKRKMEELKAEPMVSSVNLSRFAQRLKECSPKSGWLVNFTASKEASTPPPLSVPVLYKPVEFSLADYVDLSSASCKEIFLQFTSQLSCKQEDVKQIEEATRDQARLPRSLRQHTHQVGSRPRACCETAIPKPYESQGLHSELSVQKCGLLVSEDVPYLATSPDGLVHCTHCSPAQGLVEVKCPSSYRNVTPEEASRDKNFFCALVGDDVCLKKDHNYYYQVQGQMGISGRSWCDFVVWTLKGMSVERIPFDEGLWQAMLTKLKDFYVGAVIPEIFTHRVERGKDLFF